MFYNGNSAAIFRTNTNIVGVTIDGSECDISSLQDTQIICETSEHQGAIETQVAVSLGSDGIAYQVINENALN